MMQGEKREDRQSCSDLFRLIRAGASAGHCERGSSACGGSLPTSPHLAWKGTDRFSPQSSIFQSVTNVWALHPLRVSPA